MSQRGVKAGLLQSKIVRCYARHITEQRVIGNKIIEY